MIQEVLPYIAGALQWARAQKRFSEIWFAAIVAVSSFVFYCLSHPTDALTVPWNELLGGWWNEARTILAMVQAVSTSSNIIVALRKDKPKEIPGAIPVTDSQP